MLAKHELFSQNLGLHEFVVCGHFLKVPPPKQRGKNWQLVVGPLAAGAPSHGTTGTMVNPALPTGGPMKTAPSCKIYYALIMVHSKFCFTCLTLTHT